MLAPSRRSCEGRLVLEYVLKKARLLTKNTLNKHARPFMTRLTSCIFRLLHDITKADFMQICLDLEHEFSETSWQPLSRVEGGLEQLFEGRQETDIRIQSLSMHGDWPSVSDGFINEWPTSNEIVLHSDRRYYRFCQGHTIISLVKWRRVQKVLRQHGFVFLHGNTRKFTTRTRNNASPMPAY